MKTGLKKRSAKTLMTAAPVTVSPDTSLRDAVRRMLNEDVRHLPVVDGSKRLVGMLSDRDVRAAVGDPEEWIETTDDREDGDDLTVASVMTPEPVTVSGDAPLEELVETLVAGRFGALPVVDDKDRLIGMLSYIDLLRTMTPEV